MIKAQLERISEKFVAQDAFVTRDGLHSWGRSFKMFCSDLVTYDSMQLFYERFAIPWIYHQLYQSLLLLFLWWVFFCFVMVCCFYGGFFFVLLWFLFVCFFVWYCSFVCFSCGSLLPHNLSIFADWPLAHVFYCLYGHHKGNPQKIFDVPVIISIIFTHCDLFCLHYPAFILAFLQQVIEIENIKCLLSKTHLFKTTFFVFAQVVSSKKSGLYQVYISLNK